MTVYLDSFILINFFINYLLLYLTKIIYNSKTTKLKLIIGSIICVIYSLFMFIENTDFLFSIPGKLLFSFLLSAIVYRHNSIYDYVRTVLVFYIVTFVFGGAVYGIAGIINKKINLCMLFISVIAVYLMLTVFSGFYKRISLQKNSLAFIEIIVNENKYQFTGLIDTGNSLFDPYTKMPVIIVYDKSLGFVNKPLRLIPYKSLGENNGMILAFTPDKIFLNGKEIKCSVGIYNKCVLSKDNTFDAIINPEIISQ